MDNQSVSLPYSALAQAAFADGDVEQFTEYKLKAIELRRISMKNTRIILKF